jgi:hypothetical protein
VSEVAPPVIVSDEKLATTPGSVALRWLINAIAIAMSLYHMYVAAFGPPERKAPAHPDLIEALSDRELDVLRLLRSDADD